MRKEKNEVKTLRNRKDRGEGREESVDKIR